MTGLRQSVNTLLDQQDHQGCWSYPAHLGSHHISLYGLFLEWLRLRGFSSRLDLNRLARVLLRSQLRDGSWRQARDPALPSGDINATVLNYAALKFFRTAISVADLRPALASATNFILNAGGLDSANPWKPSQVEAEPSAWYDGFMVKKLLEQRRFHGSWGGYTVSTLFSIAALDHFFRQHLGRFHAIPGAIKRGLTFVDELYFDHGKGNYLGCLMDGGVWDTLLSAQALAQAGETGDPLVMVAEHLYSLQTAEGGFPYGRDFEQYPDVDDTSRALVFLKRMARHPRRPGAAACRERGLQWLLSRQNSDGDWGESTLCYLDDGNRGRGTSTPTQTAWVLEFLCQMGLQGAETVSKVVNYLLETRNGSESWRDGSVVGTGHPGILYMGYPAYPKTFPVMALANYLNPQATSGVGGSL